MLLGKPRLIPNDIWQQMEIAWSRGFGGGQMALGTGKPWDELSGTEREQVALMIMSLQEFSYGFERVNAVAESVEEGGATSRFYSNSLYQYCANYFTIAGAFKLRDVLTALGSADLTGPIRELLDTELGETTFGEIIDVFRDKFLVHQSFRLSVLDKHIYKPFDLSIEENALLFGGLVKTLFRRTQELYVALSMRYPEAHSFKGVKPL